jgi:hypothetical protein
MPQESQCQDDSGGFVDENRMIPGLSLDTFEEREKLLAFFMGTHPRLGQNFLLRGLDTMALVQMVGIQYLQDMMIQHMVYCELTVLHIARKNARFMGSGFLRPVMLDLCSLLYDEGCSSGHDEGMLGAFPSVESQTIVARRVSMLHTGAEEDVQGARRDCTSAMEPIARVVASVRSDVQRFMEMTNSMDEYSSDAIRTMCVCIELGQENLIPIASHGAFDERGNCVCSLFHPCADNGYEQ